MGLLDPEFRSRPASFCVRSGRLGKKPKKLSFLSQEEKRGLYDGWHATKGMCFLGGLGEKDFSDFGHASTYSEDTESEYIYISCSSAR